MKDKPLISIILPICNSELLLNECLESIRKQSYSNFEVIAIDDFSKDKSFRLLNKAKQIDKRFRVYKNVKHYGMAVSLNRALHRAKGKFIVFMDDVDVIKSQKLTKQLNFLVKNPKTVAIGVQHAFIDENNKTIGKSNFPTSSETIYKQPLHGISLLFSGLMINKYRLPKDLIQFQEKEPEIMYSDLFMKLLQFGEINNLPFYLQIRRLNADPKQQSITGRLNSLVKLWIKSTTYDYQLPFRSIFSAMNKQNSLSS